MVAFITGLLVGGAVGYITAALCWTAAEEDAKLLDEFGIGEDEEIHHGHS